MRYIGCKTKLLSYIDDFLCANIPVKQKSFCDIFSGTTSVARYFKQQYKIISNDNLYFSYVLQRAYITNNTIPKFEKINNLVGECFSYLENKDLSSFQNGFIAENYSPCGTTGRMYFIEENARRIDFMRKEIERWKNTESINEAEYYYLLACLIEAVPFVSNITGTYGAYLKHWDKRAYKKLLLNKSDVIDNGQVNEVYNENVFDIISHISGDILYIDPPYNSRQYAPNYHILETIAKYDNPCLSGVTGMRPYNNQKSAFCVKKEVNDAFEMLIKKADFSHIIVSYSSHGIMTTDFISDILKSIGDSKTFAVQEIPYRKYKSKKYNDCGVKEYLFYVCKK